MIRRMDAWLSWIEKVFISVLLITASLLLFANVVARYLFSAAVLGAEELVRYQIIWMVFIGGSVAARKGIHIGIDAFLKVFPEAIVRLVSILVLSLCIVFCALLFYYGLQLVTATYGFGQRSSALRMPYWIAQLAVPVGAGLMALRFAQRLALEVRGRARASDLEMIG
jgi:C4-dicarboxylate transporter, DctQ subunit